MRRLKAWELAGLGLGLVALSAGAVAASQRGEVEQAATPGRPPPPGDVTLADQRATAPVQHLGAGVLTLERPGLPLQIHVHAATPVLVEGRRGTLADIKPGRQVRVSYDVRSGRAEANWIEVLSARPVENPSAPKRKKH